MRAFILLSIFLVACHDSIGTETHKAADTKAASKECIFKFEPAPVCLYKTNKYTVNVSLATKKLAADEIALLEAKVSFGGHEHSLVLSPDTTMLQGNLGVIMFDDVNFDGVPDIAVSTSFGVANQYFDYWHYDTLSKRYLAMGNMPRLSADPSSKTLTANVKQNAATYEKQVFIWNGNQLTRTK